MRRYPHALARLALLIWITLLLPGAVLAQEPLTLDTSFAPKLYGYGRVPEMVWNPVSEWLYCRVIAEKMNGQELTTNLLRFTAEGEWDDTWALAHNERGAGAELAHATRVTLLGGLLNGPCAMGPGDELHRRLY